MSFRNSVQIKNRVARIINPATFEGQKDFFFRVINKEIAGLKAASFGGTITNLVANEKATIWDQGGVIKVLPDSPGTQLYVSSTNPTDNKTVVVGGLGVGFVELFAIATLDGYNQVPLSQLMIRVANCSYIGADGFAGNVYVAESDTLTDGVPDTASKIQIKVLAERGFGTSAITTIPARKKGYMYEVRGFINKAKNAKIILKTRPFGRTNFVEAPPFPFYEGPFELLMVSSAPIFLPEKIDIEFAAITADIGAEITLGGKLILQDI